MKPGVTRTRCTKNYDQKTKSTIANSTNYNELKRIVLNLRYISWQYCKMYLYQNQSIGRELTASDINCEVTLSLKTSDMIKIDTK